MDMSESSTFKTPAAVLRNFMLMAICFSANHGTVTALIAIASSTIGDKLSGLSFVTLYSAYTVSAMLMANVVLAKWGSKWTIVLGLGVYCVYNASFLVVNYTKGSAQELFVALGGVIGGIGAGTLWTAQGDFFASSAKQYAKLSGHPDEKAATALFAKYFASLYLGFELLMKVLLSTLNLAVPAGSEKAKNTTLFIVFTGVAVASVIGMLFVRPVKPRSREKLTSDSVFKKGTAAIKLMFTDVRVLLMLPYNFTFGFAAPFLNLYINKHVTTDVMGLPKGCPHVNHTNGSEFWADEASADMDSWGMYGAGNSSGNNTPGAHNGTGSSCDPSSKYVGWMSATVVLSAFLASQLFGKLNENNIIRKEVPMVFGSLCFATVAALFLNPNAVNDPSYWSWYNVVLLYIVFGIGRGVWESTTKAVFADFFSGLPGGPTPAFSNLVLQNGVSGAIGGKVFALASVPLQDKASTVVAFGILGIFTYLLAARITKNREVVLIPSSVQYQETKPLMNGTNDEAQATE